MTDTDNIQDQLLNEYSAIDTSTLLSIISDYDLSIPSQLEEARVCLEILEESAEAEEKSGFDASASSGIGNGAIREEGSSESMPECSTDDTSLSQGMSSLDLDDYSESDHQAYTGKELEGLDVEGKTALLAAVFPVLTPFSIQWTLKKYKRDVNLAVDDLMTQAFLEENGARPRGIEAFSELDLRLKSRKRKGKKKIHHIDELSSPEPPESPVESKWDTGTQDMEFISKRTAVPIYQVSSMYHANGTSVSATISAIIAAHQELNIEADDPIIHSRAIDLAHEFPSVALSSLEAIVQITHPSTAYAHELAKTLAVCPTNKKPNIKIEIRHTPLHLDPFPSKSKPTPYDYGNGIPLEEASAKATKYYQARDTAFQKASAAYRKGKSDHLMGGVAAYYSQQGQDADVMARSARSAAADALVTRQSSRIELDLHGLGVDDAKRITRERVTMWWHELGSRRASSYYRIVIGQGNHSDRGIAKVGPAVGKMLIRDGWKVEVGDNNGILNVTGVAKKK